MSINSLFRWLVGALLLFFLSSCATKKDLEEIESREETRVATILQQIIAINTTITDLEKAKAEINQYLETLKTSLNESDECIEANKIAIEDLQSRAEALTTTIDALKVFITTELSSIKDWTTATFATLEKLNDLTEIVAGIRADYDALSVSISQLEDRIDKQLKAIEADMKKWVNEQLSEYYTISVMDVKLAVIEKNMADNDAATKKEISAIKARIEQQKDDITSAYQKAIKEAITLNNGIIDEKIQIAVTNVNTRIDSEVETITAQLTSILNRLDSIDASLLDIYGLLKKVYPTSISVISSRSVVMGFGQTRTIDFRVNPSEASFNYDVGSEECEIELDYLGANTKAGYITTPTHVVLSKVEQMYDENQKKLQGQYRAYITDLREKRHYNDRLGLVLTVPGPSGNKVQISSSAIDLSLSVGAIVSFIIKESENPRILQENLVCNVEDGLIRGRIPHVVEDKQMIPCIEFEGEGKLILRSSPDKELHSLTDFSQPIMYDVIDEETKEVLDSYEVSISSFTGLPVVWIETENRTAITSKDEYLDAKFMLDNCEKVVNADVKIKGRGTSSWVHAEKKSYRLKFGSKESLLGEPKDKSWVMIANWFDKTMIRNSIAYYIGSISNLDYTPKFHYVDLFLNGRYDGTYMLGDKLKISKNRVNVGDDGFLVEIDAEVLKEGGVYFTTDNIPYPVSIKEPDTISVGDPDFNFVKQFFLDAEGALFSENFKDQDEGWQKYLDMTSFVDWWIIHEISKNADALMFGKSCYLNLKRGGKLRIGPIWDFDVAFGNNDSKEIYSIDGFTYIDYNNKWFKRLFEDPAFVSKVKERYEFFYNLRDEILSKINETAEDIHYSVIENENRWHTLYAPHLWSRDVWGAYNNEVYYLKNWIIQRMDWLHTAISDLN